jgi:hypothetical protein
MSGSHSRENIGLMSILMLDSGLLDVAKSNGPIRRKLLYGLLSSGKHYSRKKFPES